MKKHRRHDNRRRKKTVAERKAARGRNEAALTEVLVPGPFLEEWLQQHPDVVAEVEKILAQDVAT